MKLPTLTYRQVQGDMIDVYKFLTGKYDINCRVKLQLHSCTECAKKTGPFLNVHNFTTVSGRKACDMSKVCKFCLEKKYITCIAVCLNILRLICINIHHTRNYADNNAYFNEFSLDTQWNDNMVTG